MEKRKSKSNPPPFLMLPDPQGVEPTPLIRLAQQLGVLVGRHLREFK